jgi:non-specific serine/threonine protein kinase
MGEVYRAVDLKLGRPVAIKLLPRWAAKDRMAHQRLLREARLASALNHPNIVTIHTVGKAKGLDFIVMEYIEGETLRTRVQRGPLALAELVDFGVQVAEALADAHAIGLIHRDIKSSNILLTPRGQAKLMDFGLAKQVGGSKGLSEEHSTATDLTSSGVVMGTIVYMSPEQTRGEPLDARSDIFSLGSTLYECATGRLPFTGKSALAVMHEIASVEPAPPSTLRPELPEALDAILMWALAKNPEERYESARELSDALRELCRGSAMLAAPVAPRRRLRDVGPNNLPNQLTSFIGREKERAEVKRLLSTARLVTLTGSGGCGKTRLAVQVGSDLLSEFTDGVWLVDLAALGDPTLVLQTVASVLAVREEPGRPLLGTLSDSIGSKTLLLVLDNCEHLAAACAALAEGLLRLCPNLRILTTSREALGVMGEHRWRIPSLAVPDVRASTAKSREVAIQFESVRLFVDRAAAAQPSFSLTDQDASLVAQICHRLDGIPLAIELAAARVKMLSVEQILARLEDRFQLLTGGSRTALPRQQTLRAAVDWSYELLSPEERVLLNRLSVFAGGFSVEAVEAVCGGDGLGTGEVMDLLSHLVDKSLVVPEEGAARPARFDLLETIREYARDRLHEASDGAALPERHGAYYALLAEAAEPELQGPDQAAWLDRLASEHDNLRHAIQHFIGADKAEPALKLAGSLWRFWWVRGNLEEGRKRLAAVLAMKGASSPTAARSKTLYAAATLASGQGDYDASRFLLAESLEIDRGLGNKSGIASSLFEMGNIANDQEELAEARSLYEESLAVRRELGDQRGISSTLHNLGVVSQAQGDYAAARSLYEQALVLHRELGNRAWEAATLNGLGNIALSLGEHAAARSYQEKSLAIQREIGDKRGIAYSLRELGQVAEMQKDYVAARVLLKESLVILREIGGRPRLADTLESLASLAAAEGQLERALRLAGAAATLRGVLGTPLSRPDQEALERRLDAARQTLGSEKSARAFAGGSSMALEEALDFAADGG